MKRPNVFITLRQIQQQYHKFLIITICCCTLPGVGGPVVVSSVTVVPEEVNVVIVVVLDVDPEGVTEVVVWISAQQNTFSWILKSSSAGRISSIFKATAFSNLRKSASIP